MAAPIPSPGASPLCFVLGCLRRDWVRIAAIAAILAAAGFAEAWRRPQAASTAQLVLCGIPVYSEDQSDIDDPPTRVLAEPLDVKSASLLCTSDAAIAMTQAALGGPDAAGLAELRAALRCEFSIAAESPMQIVYSPILKLTARAATPAEAKRRADAWAGVCVDLSRQFRALRQKPVADAFQRALDEFEQAYGRPDAGASPHLVRAYEELFARAAYARVGADGDLPELQILAEGAEWPVSPGRAGARAAAVAGICGALLGVVLSIALRYVATLRTAAT